MEDVLYIFGQHPDQCRIEEKYEKVYGCCHDDMFFAGRVRCDQREYRTGRICARQYIANRSGYGSGRVEKAALYFYNSTSKTLTAEIRNLVITQDTNPAEVAADALLKGPLDNKDLNNVAPEGMQLDYIEFSRDLANVYLLYDGEAMLQRDQFIMESALANTIADILGATYISFFYNGVQSGFAGFPCDPRQKQTGNIEDAYLQASGKYLVEVPVLGPVLTPDETEPAEPEVPQVQSSELLTVLYFISSDGGYILPEVKSVTYTDGAYVETIIEELKKDPQNKSEMQSPLASDLELIDTPEFTVMADGGYHLTLNFSKPPTQFAYTDEKETALSYAALVYTITGFIPAVESIDIYVAGREMNAALSSIIRRNYLGYIGSSATLYLADKESELLLKLSRSMEQGKIWNVEARLLELMKGPLSGDGDNVWPVMPTGAAEDDILSVDIYSDTAYVNLSQHFKDACANLSSKDEMLLVYAMVNTITAMDGISKVQFLIEGKQTDTLSGNLCLLDPLLRNYGIIKQSG